MTAPTPSLRDVAQQALDALEYHKQQTRPISQTDAAIESLRAALALPDEPSMTVAFDEGAKEPRIVSWNEHPTGTHLMYSTARPAPLERQPLTDEQIEDMRGDANRGFNIEREDYFKAVRDAEAAHNIKGAA